MKIEPINQLGKDNSVFDKVLKLPFRVCGTYFSFKEPKKEHLHFAQTSAKKTRGGEVNEKSLQNFSFPNDFVILT